MFTRANENNKKYWVYFNISLLFEMYNLDCAEGPTHAL